MPVSERQLIQIRGQHEPHSLDNMLGSLPLDTWDEILSLVNEEDVKALVVSSIQLHNACIAHLHRSVVVISKRSLEAAANFWLRDAVGRLRGGGEYANQVKSVTLGDPELSNSSVKLDYDLLLRVVLPFVNTTTLIVMDRRMPWGVTRRLLHDWKKLLKVNIGYSFVDPTAPKIPTQMPSLTLRSVRHLSLIASPIWSIQSTSLVEALLEASLEFLKVDLTGFHAICNSYEFMMGLNDSPSSPLTRSLRSLIIINDTKRRKLNDIDYSNMLHFCGHATDMTILECLAGRFSLSFHKSPDDSSIAFEGVPRSLQGLLGNWHAMPSPSKIKRVSLRGNGDAFLTAVGAYWLDTSRPYTHLTALSILSISTRSLSVEYAELLGNWFPQLRRLQLVIKENIEGLELNDISAFIKAQLLSLPNLRFYHVFFEDSNQMRSTKEMMLFFGAIGLNRSTVRNVRFEHSRIWERTGQRLPPKRVGAAGQFDRLLRLGALFDRVYYRWRITAPQTGLYENASQLRALGRLRDSTSTTEDIQYLPSERFRNRKLVYKEGMYDFNDILV
ncbi:hypothetical protein AAF712_014784 [Marasmius tenuissimus]|uniref:F-box domain-containing protein n=1 Tax=Marasmius tenuissimus TaxID=585030 RepID=A0ABR2ZAZ3_9AGAR